MSPAPAAPPAPRSPPPAFAAAGGAPTVAGATAALVSAGLALRAAVFADLARRGDTKRLRCTCDATSAALEARLRAVAADVRAAAEREYETTAAAVLRQHQQRLLILRHVSKCPAEIGECTATPHCAQMKRLWKHLVPCKDAGCKVPHCVSSRYVLAHYANCTTASCDVCGPVQRAIAIASAGRRVGGAATGASAASESR